MGVGEPHKPEPQRQQPSSSDPLPHLSAGVTGLCLTLLSWGLDKWQPYHLYSLPRLSIPSERMHLSNGDNNNNTYTCVIKALDFGARFLMLNQALPLTSWTV